MADAYSDEQTPEVRCADKTVDILILKHDKG